MIITMTWRDFAQKYHMTAGRERSYKLTGARHKALLDGPNIQMTKQKHFRIPNRITKGVVNALFYFIDIVKHLYFIL